MRGTSNRNAPSLRWLGGYGKDLPALLFFLADFFPSNLIGQFRVCESHRCAGAFAGSPDPRGCRPWMPKGFLGPSNPSQKNVQTE
jgi:hypothetical protein